MDIKRVYFGNWLRDYSQACDVGGLSKITADTLVLIVGILGFLEFGYACVQRLQLVSVYLPIRAALKNFKSLRCTE